MLKKLLIIFVFLIILAFLFFSVSRVQGNFEVPDNTDTDNEMTGFEICVAAGNPIMESYPRQCIYNNITYIEDIGVEGPVVE